MMFPFLKSAGHAAAVAGALGLAAPLALAQDDRFGQGLGAVDEVLDALTGEPALRGRARPTHTIVIDGRTAPGATGYRIAGGGRLRQVEGRLHDIPVTADRNDSVSGQRAEGGVSSGADGFLVYGDLPEIVLERPQNAAIYVDGDEFHTVVITSRDVPGASDYTLSGGGFLEPARGPVAGFEASVQPGDHVRGRRARGRVTTGVDAFRVYGPLPQVELADPANAVVYIDGVRKGRPERPAPPRRYVSVEFDTNRPGSDYRNFALPGADPDRCVQACNDAERCQAYTYVPPGVQGPDARCWLKEEVPPAARASGMISGVKRSPLPQHVNRDRPGGDYRDFAMAAGAPPLRCARACAGEGRCEAYTWVAPGLQGSRPHCWLKDRVPQARAGEGLVSGTR